MTTDKRLTTQDIENVGSDHDFGGFPMREVVGFDGQSLQRLNASNLSIRIEYDGNSNPIYYAIAKPGTLDSETKWLIRKLSFDGNNNLTSIQFASGNNEFDKVWSDRVSYTYS